jgi:GntR family transcriptional regulator
MANPMYRQIAEALRGQIEAGELAPGGRLPTELELRARFDNASRNTVRDAIKWLTTLGLVETRPGQGTFVVQTIDPFITTLSGDPKTGFGGGEGIRYASEVSSRKRTPTASDIQIEIQKASSDVAGKLGMTADTVVVSRHERRYLDGTPWSMQTSFYPMDFVARGAVRLTIPEDIGEGTVKYLADTLGVHQVGYRDWLLVRAPDNNEAQFFKLPADGRTSIVEISRTAFDRNGQPMRLTVTVYPADRNQFVFDFGQVSEQETARET